MNLDELIKDSRRLKALAPKKKRATKKKGPSDDYIRTKEELRKMRLARCVPLSIHLRVTVQTCTCGRSWESVNNNPLVRRKGKELEHFEPVEGCHVDKEVLDRLPRIIEIRKVSVAKCPACFHPTKPITYPED